MAQPMVDGKYNTDPMTALNPTQLEILKKLSPEDQQLFLEGWDDPEEGATEPMGDRLMYQHGNRQGPQMPGERGPTQLRDEGGLEQQILNRVMPEEATAGGPDPHQGDELYNDPMFQDAVAKWTQMNGREPATDMDFEEVTQMMTSPEQGSDPKQLILQKLLGGGAPVSGRDRY